MASIPPSIQRWDWTYPSVTSRYWHHRNAHFTFSRIPLQKHRTGGIFQMELTRASSPARNGDNMHRHRRTHLLALTLALFYAGPAAAQTTVFSNFGAGDSYLTNGIAIGGPSGDLPDPEMAAVSFPASGTTQYLHSARMPLGALEPSDTSGTFKLHLMSDSGGLPGTVLETTSFTGGFTYPDPSIVTVTFSGTTALLPGNTYWLAMQPLDAVDIAWYHTSVTSASQLAAKPIGSGWVIDSGALPAFEVRGLDDPAETVPEPSAVLLFLPALAVVGVVQRRRRTEH